MPDVGCSVVCTRLVLCGLYLALLLRYALWICISCYTSLYFPQMSASMKIKRQFKFESWIVLVEVFFLLLLHLLVLSILRESELNQN